MSAINRAAHQLRKAAKGRTVKKFEAIVRLLALGIDRHPQGGRVRSFARRRGGIRLKKKDCGTGRRRKLSS